MLSQLKNTIAKLGRSIFLRATILLYLPCFMPLIASASIDTLVPFKCDSITLHNFEKQGIRCSKIHNGNLFCEIDKWMGVRYKVAGGSFDGTDCTHLVSNLHRAVTGAKIGGNVSHIYGACEPIPRDSLREGDLVFFKINKSNLSHVGLYLQGDLFVHATVNKGVVISSLMEDYYRKYFVGCGRIKPEHYPSTHEIPK